VLRIDVDATVHKAVVLIEINARFNQIPDDSDASINTQGLLGGEFIRIVSGGSDDYLHENSRFMSTHSAVPLESLLSQVFRHK
jgi:phospholipid/cholesterol/gamma-HCH transport system substrate-binding protein